MLIPVCPLRVTERGTTRASSNIVGLPCSAVSCTHKLFEVPSGIVRELVVNMTLPPVHD